MAVLGSALGSVVVQARALAHAGASSRSHEAELPLGRAVYRKATFPTPPANMKAWMDGGLNLARRAETVSWYVARRELYRDIFRDRYAQDPAGSELIFYKRLNKTGFMVSYRANGQIDDYAFFPEINWREFLAVPDAFLR